MVRLRVPSLRRQSPSGASAATASSSESDGRPARLKPLFVGGTGRSGTHVVARLLGAHPAYYRFASELRFIANPGGLCDLVEGRTDVARFAARMRGPWYGARPAVLGSTVDAATIEAALGRLEADMAGGADAAAVAFAHDLLDPIAARHGAGAWIEKSPPNVMRAGTLLRLFPDMQLIHSVRDGRDVACSVIRLRWGPTDVEEALDWWARKLERAFAACESLPEGRVCVVQMEDLLTRDRDRQYARLLAFLDLPDDPAMRAYFDASLTPERAHIGRWREDVPAERRAAFDAHYQRLAAGLRARGRPVAADDEPVTA